MKYIQALLTIAVLAFGAFASVVAAGDALAHELSSRFLAPPSWPSDSLQRLLRGMMAVFAVSRVGCHALE
jgi:hypothetical protein